MKLTVEQLKKLIKEEVKVRLLEQLSRDPAAEATASVTVIQFSQGDPRLLIHGGGSNSSRVEDSVMDGTESFQQRPNIEGAIGRAAFGAPNPRWPGHPVTSITYRQNLQGSPALIINFEGGVRPNPQRMNSVATTVAGILSRLGSPARVSNIYVARPSDPGTPLR